MTTITLQDLSAWTEREKGDLYLVELTKAAPRNIALWICLPVLLLVSLLLAQAFPFRILKVVRRINGVLPNVENDAVLALVHDMYQLAYSAGAFYFRFCIFRGTMRAALDELDESIDSLAFVASHQGELRAFVTASESRMTPNLPLPFEPAAS